LIWLPATAVAAAVAAAAHSAVAAARPVAPLHFPYPTRCACADSAEENRKESDQD